MKMRTKTTTTSSTATTTPEPEGIPELDTSAPEVRGQATTEPATATPPAEQAPRHLPEPQKQAGSNTDIDDVEQLIIPQNYVKKIGVKKAQSVQLRKAKGHEFYRRHPTCEPMLVGTVKYEQELFVVRADLVDSHPGLVIPVELTLCITRQEAVLLWPLPIPGDDGRINTWHASARAAVERARQVWVRLQANMAIGDYDLFEALGALPDPQWPDLSMAELVRIGVKGRVIDSLDHPVLQKLRGEL
jgi:hypothetical protein